MATKISCPSCQKSIYVDEQEGAQLLLCPACGIRFNSPALESVGEGDVVDPPAATDVATDPAEAPASGSADGPIGSAAPPNETAVITAAADLATFEIRETPRDPSTAAVRTVYASPPAPAHRPLAWLAAGVVLGMIPSLVALALVLRHQERTGTTIAATPDAAAVVDLRHASPPPPAPAASPSRTARAADSVAHGPAPEDASGIDTLSWPAPPPGARPVAPDAGSITPGDDRTAATTAPADAGADDEPIDMTAAPAPDAGDAAAPAPTTAPSASQPSAISPATAASAPTTRPLRTAVVTRPALAPTPIPATGGVTDEMIEKSIRAGIENLASKFNRRSGQMDADAGRNALAVYALLQAGLAVNDQRLHPGGPLGKALLDGVRDAKFDRNFETYSRALRVSCLSLFNRRQDRLQLRMDVNKLVSEHKNGAYGYGSHSHSSSQGWSDNSNSQYGLLGVWAGADAGAEVPISYWEDVERHWVGCQSPNGTWGYQTVDSSMTVGSGLSMTAAGVASLFVVRDQLDAARPDFVLGRPPFSPSLAAGLGWLETGGNAFQISGHYGYTLYGVERVGLASGLKYFGAHDWYRRLAADAISRQQPDGGWGDPVETSFVLLFLSRGRHPILFNKLRFDGYWSNRRRDLSGLTRYVSRAMERPLNWQVVSIKTPWDDWADAPVLYIASHRRPRFSKEEYDKLRNFALAGGLIFTHADGGMIEFDKFATDLARKLFPAYEYTDVPPGHPLYTTPFKVDARRVPLRAISNGSRVLMLHTSADLAKTWMTRRDKTMPHVFQIGANLHVYAAGARDLRNRLQSPHLPEPPGGPLAGVVRVARLEYAGNWDPEPWAWTRFVRLMRYRTGTAVDVLRTKWSDLRPETAPFAHLTGTAGHDPTDAEVAATRAYVEAGGVLLIDDCGGSRVHRRRPRRPRPRASAARRAAAAGYPPAVRAGPPGMTAPPEPVLRPFASGRVKPANAVIEAIPYGKGTVLISRLDVVSGLLGTGTWGITGYSPKWSDAFVQNAIFWTLDGQPDPRRPAPRNRRPRPRQRRRHPTRRSRCRPPHLRRRRRLESPTSRAQRVRVIRRRVSAIPKPLTAPMPRHGSSGVRRDRRRRQPPSSPARLRPPGDRAGWRRRRRFITCG